MSLKVGIIGLPNVGKSTLFNALLKKQQALVANYPFATIEPNVGVVPVPEPRLQVLSDITQASEIIPATVEFVDIAGLVENAHKGEGLGNQFLSHIREVDLICHVLRFFDDTSVHHVTGSVDPLRDKEIVETELQLADLATLEKQVEPKGQISKVEEERWRVVSWLKERVGDGLNASDVVGDQRDQEIIRDLHLLTMKPVLYIANVSEESLTDQYDYQSISKKLDSTITREQIVPICAQVEQDIADFSQKEQTQYLKSLGISDSGLGLLIRKACSLLNYITFFTTPTAKTNEVRAWKIVAGSTAVEAGGEVHTDFSSSFIKAEVVPFADFEKCGGWRESFEKGKVRLEGRDYAVEDGDVITFKVGR